MTAEMTPALRLDLEVPCGSFDLAIAWETERTALGLFGASGAGKSSVLEALAGIRRGVRGRIEVGGRTWLDSGRGIALAPEARGVGHVPQEAALFPHRDVLGNLRFGERRARRHGQATRRLLPEAVLELLELTHLARRPVTALSGGERQRVALGRALCSAPDLLLLDEPLASLDLPLRRRILPYLLRIRDDFGIPTVHVSHDPSEITLLSREICVLAAGRVVACGPPREIFGAHSLAGGAAGLTGRSGQEMVTVFEGTVAAVAESLAMIEIEPGLQIAVADEGSFTPGQRIAFELRASDILVACAPVAGLSAQNVLAGTVREVHLPPAGEIHAAAVVSALLGREGRPIAAVVSRRACRELGLTAGAPIQVIFKAQACRLLAAY
jgi:molybdate transport system ATP-binding protein